MRGRRSGERRGATWLNPRCGGARPAAAPNAVWNASPAPDCVQPSGRCPQSIAVSWWKGWNMPVEHSPRRANPGKLLLPFIPRQMDDAGLTPAQFRLVCRVARRGVCTESIPKIAAGCRLAVGTVKKVLPFLVASNVLAKEKRSGQTSVLKVIPPGEWQVEPRPKGNLGKKATQHPIQTDTEANSHPSHSDQKTAHKGNPIKAIQTRGNSPGLKKRRRINCQRPGAHPKTNP